MWIEELDQLKKLSKGAVIRDANGALLEKRNHRWYNLEADTKYRSNEILRPVMLLWPRRFDDVDAEVTAGVIDLMGRKLPTPESAEEYLEWLETIASNVLKALTLGD